MSKGTVKFFNETKGFGFVVDEETNKESIFSTNDRERRSLKSPTSGGTFSFNTTF